MRNLTLYPRLAAQSIRKNARYYLPYFLSSAGAASVFYILFFLSGNEGLSDMRGSAYVLSMLYMGTGIAGIFSAILVFYTNGFLMKRRRQELGLFRVLGMEKRHVGRVLAWETLYTALISILGGLALGILLSKLALLALCAILHEAVPFGFYVSLQGAVWTAGAFAFIFFLCLLANLRRVGRLKPIELLHSARHGEREPKSRWPLTVLGVLALGTGYGIAISVQHPLAALGLFFVAVLLVIAGTFCLFTAGSIGLLKLLRRNKALYYKTRNFISISGMLHRMKRNAAGLATVCILCSMVLVTVSTTVCLYLGAQEAIDEMYPRDVQVFLHDSDLDSLRAMEAAFREEAALTDTALSALASCAFYDADTRVNTWDDLPAYLEAYTDGAVLGEDTGAGIIVYVGANVAGGKAPEAFSGALWSRLDGLRFEHGYVELKSEGSVDLLSTMGGFFFIGLLLGFLFLMATVLIIYYKQTSEGYEDARGYQIMQQVGLSQAEVRGSIHRQIMTVFFLPLLSAGIHICFAFNMIVRMLSLFNLHNISLFALCCLGTFLVFAAIYAAIYALTAKAYYRIVKA